MKKGKKTYKRKQGGKLKGYGSYGCTYSPSVRCLTAEGEILSSEKSITKFMDWTEAEKEIDTGIMIEDAFEEAGITVNPLSIILYPKVLCEIPGKRTPAEIAENPLNNCPVKARFTRPILAQMVYGGEDLHKFECPKEDIPEFLKSIVGLTHRLRIFHEARLGHFDIKSNNVVTKKVGTKYITKFIDVGFVKDLVEYDIRKPFGNFNGNYQIWPYETRFLYRDITTTDFTQNTDAYLEDLRQFYLVQTDGFKYYGFPANFYIRNGIFAYVKEVNSIPTFSELFLKNIEYLKSIYNSNNDYYDVVKLISKATDVYSFGILLYVVYCKITKHRMDDLYKIRYMGAFTSQADLNLFTEVVNQVSIPFFEMIFSMLEPDIQKRETNLTIIAQNTDILFDRLIDIYKKHGVL